MSSFETHKQRDLSTKKNTHTQTERNSIKLEMNSQHIDVTLTPRKTKNQLI